MIKFQRTDQMSRTGIGIEKAVAILLLMAIVGCGSGTPSNRGQVTGLVTVDGVEPDSGAIAFSPVDGASPTAGGKIVDGKYSVEVPLGLCSVSIRVPKVMGEQKLYDTPDSPVQQVMAESLPPKFNDETELTLEVTPGENSHDFVLSSK